MRAFKGYQVIRSLGAGGMSRVYLARHPSLPHRFVAVKVLDPELALLPEFVKRFGREVDINSRLEHPNIASVLDYGKQGRTHFLVMEYVQGKDLREILDTLRGSNVQGARLPASLALSVVEEVAQGLRYAHMRGVIHRDIKPSNLRISESGHVKILDFGLARPIQLGLMGSQGEVTNTGVIVGTAAYMSPEQAAGEQDLDARSDIFSLGVVAYELLSGRKPFLGSNGEAVRQQILNGTHVPLAAAPDLFVPAELNRLVEQMLARRREQRLSNMDAVLAQLRDCWTALGRLGITYFDRTAYLQSLVAAPGQCVAELNADTLKGLSSRKQELERSGASQTAVYRELSHATERLSRVLAPSEPSATPKTRTWRPGVQSVQDRALGLVSSVAKRPRRSILIAAILVGCLALLVGGWQWERKRPASLTITGQPTSLEISLLHPRTGERRVVGYLPVDLFDLSPGIWEVRASAKGYLAQWSQRELEPGCRDTLELHLLPEPPSIGWLSLTGMPTGTQLVYYPLVAPQESTAILLQEGRLVRALPPGDWVGEARCAGHNLLTTRWRIAAAETTGVELALEPAQPHRRTEHVQPARLVVTSRPLRASVYIDGKLMPEPTPYTFQLAPGEHQVRVVLELTGGMREQTRNIELEAGQSGRLEFSFD